MGRKSSPETSPEYGSFIVSILSRSTDFMGTPDRECSRRTAETLEKTLQATLTIPEIREFMAAALHRIISTSPSKWYKAVRYFITVWLDLFSKALVETGEPDPLSGLSARSKIRCLLTEIGWNGNLAEFAAWSKKLIIKLLERITSGEKAELAEWSTEITSGVFSDDPEKAAALIRLSLLASGGTDLLTEVDSAVKMVIEKLHSSVEFKAAVELAEEQQKWGGILSNQRFKEAWDNMRPSVMGRVRGKNLAIPGPHETDQHYHKTWSEEENLAMNIVFQELLKRARESPFKLIADTWNGRLKNSLVIAVENDLIDKIRHETAKKRDVRKRESLKGEGFTDRTSMRKASILSSGDPLDLLTDKATRAERMSLLTEVEKAIITLIGEGFSKGEIASKFGKSPAWVSKKLKGVREKLKPFINI